MKKLLIIAAAILTLAAHAANPSYQSMVTGGFLSNNFAIYLSTGMTNDWESKIVTASNVNVTYSQGVSNTLLTYSQSVSNNALSYTNALVRTNDTHQLFLSGRVNVTNDVQVSSLSFLTNRPYPFATVITGGAGSSSTAKVLTNFTTSDHDFVVRVEMPNTAIANSHICAVTYGTSLANTNIPLFNICNKSNMVVNTGNAQIHVDSSTCTPTGFNIATGTSVIGVSGSTNDFHVVVIGN